MDQALDARRCRATNRDGHPCGRTPAPGAFVCSFHGGKTPAAVMAAKARLAAGADLAIAYLVNMLEPREPCLHCGRIDDGKDPVVVRACQLVLDRSGFGPGATLTVNQSDNALTDLTLEELACRAEEIAISARQMADEEREKYMEAAEVAAMLGEPFFDDPLPDRAEVTSEMLRENEAEAGPLQDPSQDRAPEADLPPTGRAEPGMLGVAAGADVGPTGHQTSPEPGPASPEPGPRQTGPGEEGR
jgi:hypothetical protein